MATRNLFSQTKNEKKMFVKYVLFSFMIIHRTKVKCIFSSKFIFITSTRGIFQEEKFFFLVKPLVEILKRG